MLNLKSIALLLSLAFTTSLFANICEVNSFVFVPDQAESQAIFSAKFEVNTLERCIAFVRENIHLRLLGPDYDKTIIVFYIDGLSIPVQRIVMDKNYK